MDLVQPVLLAVGGPTCLAGVVVWMIAARGEEAAVRRRLRRTPQVQIRRIARAGPVTVTGVARQGPAGMVTATLSGAPTLLYRASALSRRGGDQSHTFRTLHREADQRPFTVDDGTGQVDVDPSEVQLLLPVSWEGAGRDEWLRSRIGHTTGGVRYVERRIDDLQPVTVSGMATRSAGGGWRMGGPGEGLVVLGHTLEEAMAQLGDASRVGRAALVLGLLLLCLGLVAGAVGS